MSFKILIATITLIRFRLRMSDEKYELAASLQDAFNLQPIDEKRSRVFGDRPMGVDPIDYKEAANENVKLSKKEE
jgi:hypothetical protein